MPSWDRPSGGDKPSAPRFPPGSHPQTDPAAGNQLEQPKGVAQDGVTRQRDKPPEERGARGREGVAAGDGIPKDTERSGYEALFERQDKLIEGQEQQIGKLMSDLGKRDAEIARLKKENETQAATIERLESADNQAEATEASDKRADTSAERIGELQNELSETKAANAKLTDTVARLTETNSTLMNTNARLMDKVEKAESERDEARAEAVAAQLEVGKPNSETAETADRPADGQSIVDEAPNAVGRHSKDGHQDDLDPPWYKKLPSKPVTDIIAKAATAGATIAVATGAVNGTAEKVTAGVAAVGWAVMEYRQQKGKKEKGDNHG